jgi:antitoxin MazE
MKKVRTAAREPGMRAEYDFRGGVRGKYAQRFPANASSPRRLHRAGVPTYTQCIHREAAVQTKIQNWGNSLGLRIPRALAVEAGVRAGSEVDLSIQNGDLVVTPARRRKYRLKDLLEKVTARNVHAEVDTGGPVGKETW